VQFIDLKTQYEKIANDVEARVLAVLRSQRYIMGPEVSELEASLADYLGVKHAISCSSGTDALVIALMALGIKPGDAILVPSFTFFASAESVTLAGATPVFVDCNRDDYNISCDDLPRAIAYAQERGLEPKGIIAVDLFGQTANYEEIEAFAAKHSLFVLEDAAQSFGATAGGRKAGCFGIAAATSFFPAKPLGAYGDGGAVFTSDDSLADAMRSVRIHGQGSDKYDNVRIGINGRLDTIQAAVLLAKLPIFAGELLERQRVAQAYSEKLADLLVTPAVLPGRSSAWAQYSLLAASERQRAAIIAALNAEGIPTAIYYPRPIHLSSAYAHLGYRLGDLPVCEDLAARIFSVPMHPYLGAEDIERICRVIRAAL
jgi:dTDP-4-amino-4,6-dideoxygalactose transaminase